jgi:hypothetical protein
MSGFGQTCRAEPMAHKIRIFDRNWHLPQSKAVRIGIGVLLVIGGLVGFLPVLGFWMIPLGLLVLSIDLPIVRRWRRQLTVWWHRRKDEGSEEDAAPAASASSSETRIKKKTEATASDPRS